MKSLSEVSAMYEQDNPPKIFGPFMAAIEAAERAEKDWADATSTRGETAAKNRVLSAWRKAARLAPGPETQKLIASFIDAWSE